MTVEQTPGRGSEVPTGGASAGGGYKSPFRDYDQLNRKTAPEWPGEPFFQPINTHPQQPQPEKQAGGGRNKVVTAVAALVVGAGAIGGWLATRDGSPNAGPAAVAEIDTGEGLLEFAQNSPVIDQIAAALGTTSEELNGRKCVENNGPDWSGCWWSEGPNGEQSVGWLSEDGEIGVLITRENADPNNPVKNRNGLEQHVTGDQTMIQWSRLWEGKEITLGDGTRVAGYVSESYGITDAAYIALTDENGKETITTIKAGPIQRLGITPKNINASNGWTDDVTRIANAFFFPNGVPSGVNGAVSLGNEQCQGPQIPDTLSQLSSGVAAMRLAA